MRGLQSLAYSPLGTVANTCEKHLLTDHLSAQQPHCEHRWTKHGNNYQLRPYNFFCLKLRDH